MEARHGKGPMDGVRGTIKNQVYKEVKSGRIVIDALQEFAMAAQTVPAITIIYLPESEMLQEPNEIENVHKVARKFNLQGVACIEFYSLLQFYKLEVFLPLFRTDKYLSDVRL